ncbi:MAG: tRNA uridine-5-carboxymethylaminomethyl(34) synthesis GTPase MnmE [Cytophagales bacterium]|nr:tRNA uridine-5-carboxymethylaminomethyl(34) synthesis GTPase MnmE [Cytophagales bacterium]
MSDDVIIALATGYSPTGAIAIIRISGEGCIRKVNPFVSINLLKAHDHTIHFCNIYDSGREVIDEILISVFYKNHSYTKEESLEISCHNSRYIITTIINTLIGNGMRLSSPGEFTRRAFSNGRMDLSQAEAVADMIAAKSKAAHDIALTQMRGVFSQKIKTIKERILSVATQLEIDNDFSEEDISLSPRNNIITIIQDVLNDVDNMLHRFSHGEVIRHGLPVAIIGRPNVGKSSLLNVLLEEERAIVSPLAGTTRDTIEAEVNIDDISCRFIDTAGIRDDYADDIEKAGIERTKKTIAKAQMVLFMVDVTMTGEDYKEQLEAIRRQNKDLLIVVNKMDLDTTYKISEEAIYISTKNKSNIDAIKEYITKKYNMHNDEIFVNARHVEVFKNIKTALAKTINAFEEGISSEFIMSEINNIILSLNTITGETSSQETLDNIFSRFCVGK